MHHTSQPGRDSTPRRYGHHLGGAGSAKRFGTEVAPRQKDAHAVVAARAQAQQTRGSDADPQPTARVDDQRGQHRHHHHDHGQARCRHAVNQPARQDIAREATQAHQAHCQRGLPWRGAAVLQQCGEVHEDGAHAQGKQHVEESQFPPDRVLQKSGHGLRTAANRRGHRSADGAVAWRCGNGARAAWDALAHQQQGGQAAHQQAQDTHHQEGLSPAEMGDDRLRPQRVNDGTDGSTGKQQAQGSAHRLVEPALHQLSQAQERCAGRRQHQQQAKPVVGPDTALHQGKRCEVGRLQHHAGQDERAQRNLVDDPPCQRRHKGGEQGRQGEREGDLAPAPAQALLQWQQEQAEGAAVQRRHTEQSQHPAASQRAPTGRGVGRRNLIRVLRGARVH